MANPEWTDPGDWGRDNYPWERFFCFLPYEIEGETVWLRHAERRITFVHMYGENYEYRLIR